MIRALVISLFGLLLLPSLLCGYSASTAVGYGTATHLDDAAYLSEWYGADGSVADGLTFSPFVTGETATLDLSVSLNNFFDAGSYEWASIWIDWDHNFNFDDYELVYDVNDFWFYNGLTSFQSSFVVPNTAILGETWMRARLSADGDLAATGDYFTGEVEDYRVNVQSGTDVVPEPASLSLFGVGLLISGWVARRRKKGMC